jgi:lipopolysaccharide export system protein LptC
MIHKPVKQIIKPVKKLFNLLLEPVIGYTRVVFATKFLLSSIVVVLVLALIALPLLNHVQDNFRLTFSGTEVGIVAGNPTMVNPHFQGIDQEDRSYEITADSATTQKDETLVLNNINASINLKDDSWVAMIAKTGRYNRKQNYLELSDSVTIFTNDGYELYTKSILVNMEAKSARGESSIQAHGPMGSLTADSFNITENGDRAFFEGHVKVIYNRN